MAKKSDFLKKISKTSIGVASIISSTTTIAISTGCADISQESEFPSFSLKCADATNNQMTYIDPVYGSPFPTQQWIQITAKTTERAINNLEFCEIPYEYQSIIQMEVVKNYSAKEITATYSFSPNALQIEWNTFKFPVGMTLFSKKISANGFYLQVNTHISHNPIPFEYYGSLNDPNASGYTQYAFNYPIPNDLGANSFCLYADSYAYYADDSFNIDTTDNIPTRKMIPATIKSIYYDKTSFSILQKIGARAFINTTGVQQLELPPSVSVIGEQAFFGSSNLKQISMIDVQQIGDYAFGGLPKLYDPVNPYDFSSVSFEPEPLENPQVTPFKWYIQTDENNKVIGKVLSHKNTSKTVVEPTMKVVGSLAMGKIVVGRKGYFGSLSTSTAIKKVDAKSFSHCASLVSVDFDDNIVEIEESSFDSCSSLDTIYLRSDNLVTLDDTNAFDGCPLENIYVPSDLLQQYHDSNWGAKWPGKIIKPIL